MKNIKKTKMKTVSILILIIFIIFQSCKKEDETQVFKNDIHISNLTCYPNDNISMTFTISSAGGKSPYTYSWIYPSAFNGNGPFTIKIDQDIVLKLEVYDANNIKVNYQYEIKKDTIDSLKYDYRHSLVGLYKCEVICKTTKTDGPPNEWITQTKKYQDTLEVTENSDFTKLSFSGAPVATPDVSFNIKNFTFEGYHTSGTIKNDSIHMYTFYTPSGLTNYTYNGIKIK